MAMSSPSHLSVVRGLEPRLAEEADKRHLRMHTCFYMFMLIISTRHKVQYILWTLYSLLAAISTRETQNIGKIALAAGIVAAGVASLLLLLFTQCF